MSEKGGVGMKCEDVYKIFSSMPCLETERLVLRQMCVSDCFDMFEYACKPEVTKYLSWSPHPSIEYTKNYLNYLKGHYKIGDFFDWAVVLKSENKMIGTCGFTRFNYNHDCGEVGYVINPKYRGQGIAPEALLEVMSFGFDRLLLNRIEAKYIDGNTPSRRVMEKVGMKFEGIRQEEMLIKGAYRDIGVCAVLKKDFKSIK